MKPSAEQTPESWYRLRLFNYLRGVIALAFIVVYFNGWLDRLVFTQYLDPAMFSMVAFAYAGASVIFAISLYLQKPAQRYQVITQIIVDIACITLLMHASGGVRTGVGMLLIINIAMSALFLQRRIAILFAAIATLAIIAEQIYAQYIYFSITPAFTQAGLLGILIFLAAILASYTSIRLRESEQIAEEASHELESIIQLNEHIIQSMRTGIMVVMNNGRVQMANRSAAELLGCKQTFAGSDLRSISPGLYDRFSDWLETSTINLQPVQQSYGLPDIQPGFSQIDRSDGPRSEGRSLIFLEDATQLAQRFQQVKLASLGRLTASIAHEIRNPLAAINHAGQLLEETSEDEADRKLTNIINTQVLRLNAIVENVLQLSRQQRGTPESVDLEPWLLHFIEEFSSTNKLKPGQIDVHIDEPDMHIQFDSDQLHQVLWNLCSNAMNHADVSTEDLKINITGGVDEDWSQNYIDIADNGCGIDEETQSQIFEPFFTTSSSGTGLGLYITKEVIESNRAKIRVQSKPGAGTCFRIRFQSPPQT